jgi:hypothetical protein
MPGGGGSATSRAKSMLCARPLQFGVALPKLNEEKQTGPKHKTSDTTLASVQTCIVHLSRYCLSFCGWKERQVVARELKAIYRAETAEAAAKRLSEFDAGLLGQKVSDNRRELGPQLGADRHRKLVPFVASGLFHVRNDDSDNRDETRTASANHSDQSPIRSRSSHWRQSPLKPNSSAIRNGCDHAPFDLLAGLARSLTRASILPPRLIEMGDEPIGFQGRRLKESHQFLENCFRILNLLKQPCPA